MLKDDFGSLILVHLAKKLFDRDLDGKYHVDGDKIERVWITRSNGNTSKDKDWE